MTRFEKRHRPHTLSATSHCRLQAAASVIARLYIRTTSANPPTGSAQHSSEAVYRVGLRVAYNVKTAEFIPKFSLMEDNYRTLAFDISHLRYLVHTHPFYNIVISHGTATLQLTLTEHRCRGQRCMGRLVVSLYTTAWCP